MERFSFSPWSVGNLVFTDFLCLIVSCEQALSGVCGGGKEQKRPVGISRICEFHTPDLRYIVFFVIFLKKLTF